MHGTPVSPNLAWDDVRLFLALCRSRTVGEAGRSLGVDASTVSRRMATLEEALATTLFDRGRGGVSRTQAAEDLMPAAERIEEAMAGFTTAAEGLERTVAGLVRITCPADVAETVVAPLLPDLIGRHPELRVELEAGEAVRDLGRREADIALRTVRPERGDLLVTKLVDMRWVVAASPKLAKKLGTLKSWSAAPWVGWGERLGHTPPARWYAAHVKSEPAIRSDNLRVQLAVVESGTAIALVPEPSVEAYGLVPVKTGSALRASVDAWPKGELFLVTHRALREVPRVRVVWELLAGNVRAGARAVKAGAGRTS
jgi:DNA-binding transcriptional LysR family regulator